MDKLDALRLVANVCALAPLIKKDQESVQAALSLLVTAIKEPEKKEEPSKDKK